VGDQKIGRLVYSAEGELTDAIRLVPFYHMLSNTIISLNREGLNNFAPLSMGSTAGLLFMPPIILLLGESRPSTMGHIVDFGSRWALLDIQELSADAEY